MTRRCGVAVAIALLALPADALTVCLAMRGRGTPTSRIRTLKAIRCLADSYDTNELVVAARKGQLPLLTELITDNVDVNLAVSCTKIQTMDGAPALIWAARQGQLEAVKLLLRSNADVNAVTISGWTALYVAALNGHELIVDELLSGGASAAAVFSLGDERTSINLRRMIESSGRSSPPAEQPERPQPEDMASKAQIIGAASTFRDNPAGAGFKAVARQQATSGSVMEPPLSGMSELDAMRLRLEWRAPPTIEEQRAADRARQTVFKYRHDRIQELETALATQGAEGLSVVSIRAPASTPVPPPPLSPPAEAVPGLPVKSEPDSAFLSRLEAVEASTLLSRLEAVEATLAELRSAKGADPRGFADGYGEGYAAGFAAGRDAK